MSEEQKGSIDPKQDVNNVETVEKTETTENTESKGTEKNKKKIHPALLVLGVVGVGAVSLYAGTALGTMLGTPDEIPTPDVASESEEEEKGWVAGDLVDGEPKTVQEDVVNRQIAPWSDNYKLDDTHLDYLTADEIQAKIDSGERFVVYFGRATCPYCHEYRQLQDKALENLDETIYSVDTEYYMDNEQISEIRAELGVEFVPNVVVIEDGKVIEELPEDVQVSSVEGVSEWLEGIMK